MFFFAILLYPGLGLLLGLALLLGWLLDRRLPARLSPRAAVATLHGQLALASIGLAALGLALLPWPLHPLGAGAGMPGGPALLWAAFEAACLLPLLPGYLAAQPLAVRASLREAQLGLAGRSVLWVALGLGLWGGVGWALPALPGRLLLALGGLLALPAAMGVGPFSAERSLAPAGAEAGLDEDSTALVRFARTARGAALLALWCVAALPLGAQVIPVDQPWVALLVLAALFVALALLLRRVSALMPRMTLPGALRWCWWRALPLALLGIVYLAAVSGW